MAYRDYILCKTCGCKIVYDGDDNGRNMLETYWGNPTAPDWTVGLLCPDCIAQMEAENERLRADAGRYRWLRDPANAYRDEWNYFGPYSSEAEIDAVIDAARAALKESK